MKTHKNGKLVVEKIRNVKSVWLLLVGILTMSLTHLTINIDALAWISMVPFLLYLRRNKGVKSILWFTLILILTWSVIVLKIITDPIPVFIVPMYSIPIALIHLPGYLLYQRFSHNKWSVFIFPAAMVVLEWVQYTFTPLASWGAVAYTQIDSIQIAQSLSLFGMAGLGFLIYWINSALAELINGRKASFQNVVLPLAFLAITILFGHLRYDISKLKGKDTIKVAAIGTDSTIGGLPLPSDESNEKVISDIFKRTKVAGRAGAKLAVWTEAAFFVHQHEEDRWKDSIIALAKNNDIALIASFVVPVSDSPFQFENKYLNVTADGEITRTYLKHEPVPGEPAVKGFSKLEVEKVEGSNIGGAICYDYDFPYLAQENSDAGADIVALPSSDWRGIDPIHTKMAAFRAIEQGHSILRSTRFGLSAGINPYGEMVAQLSSFDDNDKTMITHLPRKKVFTVYSVIGDLFIYSCIVFLFVFFVAGRWLGDTKKNDCIQESK